MMKKLDFSNPQDNQCFLSMYNGIQIAEEMPNFYKLYQDTANLHAKGIALDYPTYASEGIGFKDGIDIDYFAYNPKKKTLCVGASSSFTGMANFIDESLEIRSEDGTMLADVRKSTSSVNSTNIVKEFKFESSNYKEKLIKVQYKVSWMDTRNKVINALCSSADFDAGVYFNSFIESVSLDFPKNINTPENSPIVICYGRNASGEILDKAYPDIYKNNKPCLFLDFIGDVAFEEPESNSFSSIDVTSFELKVNSNSGYALYRLAYTENDKLIDRTQEIIKSFTKTTKGFHFKLDNDWKDLVPALSYPVRGEVKLTFRVDFKLKNGRNGVLQISSSAAESTPNVKKIPTLRMLWGCLAKGSMILMADGSQKPIEEVKTGERVTIGFSRASALVSNCWKGHEFQQMIHIEAENGGFITCSSAHPIITVNGITAACDIKTDDSLIDSYGEPVKIRAISKVDGDDVYNLSLEPNEKTIIYAEGRPITGTTMICNGFMVGDNEMQNNAILKKENFKPDFAQIEESNLRQAFFNKTMSGN